MAYRTLKYATKFFDRNTSEAANHIYQNPTKLLPKN